MRLRTRKLSPKYEIRFTRASNVLGIIYNSKSGNTQLKWRHLKGRVGRLSGEASTNTLVNLFASQALPESYAIAQREHETKAETEQTDEEVTEEELPGEPESINEAFADT